MKQRSLWVAAATCVCLMPLPVLAVTSSAQLGPLMIVLHDLDANDGVTPSIQFNGVTLLYTEAVDQPAFSLPSSTTLGGAFESGGTASSSMLASASVSSSVDGAGPASGGWQVNGQLFATGAVDASPADGAGLGITGGYYSASLTWNGWPESGSSTFTLSSGTRADFYAQVTTSASVSATDRYEFGSASAGLWIVDAGGVVSESSVQSFSTNLVNGDLDHPVFASAADSHAGEVSVSFSNASTDSVSGQFWAVAGASGYSQVAAVPEPPMTLLMMAGLGVLGIRRSDAWRLRRPSRLS